ncbi:MAG: PilZ domain-containing protein [Candidatus Xenobia bacterium]
MSDFVDNAENRESVRHVAHGMRRLPVLWHRTDGERRFYINIVDFSDTGLKLASSIPLPAGEQVRMTVMLEPPLKLSFRVMWQTTLLGGTHLFGCRLIRPSKALKAELSRNR